MRASSSLRFALAVLIIVAARAAVADDKAPVFVPPKLHAFVKAEAPASLPQRAPVDVTMTIDIDDKGVPTKVAVEKSAGGDDAAAYDDAAVAAAQQFRFEPGTADGKPVPVRITYRYHFTYTAPPPPPPPPAEPVVSEVPETPRVPFGGQVRRAGDRTPLAGITITVDDGVPEPPTAVTTDENGRFHYDALPIGKRTFKLRGGDIVGSDVKAELKSGKRLEVTWYVTPRTRFESTTRGKRVVQETVEYVLSADEVKHIPGTTGDTLKAIQNLPGVARAAFGGGQLAVWGSSPADTRTYVDNVPIPILFHFGGLRSTVNGEVIQDLRFLPGGYSADYGRGTGGVIGIDTRRPKDTGIHGFVQLDLIDGSLMLEGKITKNLSFLVAGRRSWIDAFIPLFTTSSFQLSPSYYDYQAKLSWRATPRDDVDLFIFGSDDILKIKLKQPDPSLSAAFDSNNFYHRALVRWLHRFPKGVTLSVTPSVGYDVPFDVNANFGNVPISIDARLLSYNVKATARIPLTSWLRLDTGLDYEGNRWHNSALAPSTGVPREGDTGGPNTSAFSKVDAVFYTNAIAPYFITDFHFFNNKVSISPQVRLETYNWSDFQHGQTYDHTYFRVEPRLQMRYDITPKFAITAAIGLYDQLPDPLSLTPVFGNPNVRPLVAVHYVLGFEAHPWTKALIQVQGFYKDLYDLIERGETANDPIYTNNGRGRVYGGTFFLRQELWHNFFGWISYTLSRSERKVDPEEPWRLFEMDQTHIFTLIASYKLPHGFQLGLRFRVVTGNPITPVRGAYYNANESGYEPIYGPTYSARLGTFNQLDLRFDKQWTFHRWALSIYLDIQNLYDAKNPEGITYNYNFSQSAPITGLPFLPVLGIRGDF